MIAEQIKALRHRDRLSQKELAKRLAVGQSTIAMWETGTNTPGYTNLVKLANLFNVSVGDLTQGPLITAFDWDEGDISKNLQQMLKFLQQTPHTLSFNGEPLTELQKDLLIENLTNCLKICELVFNAEHAQSTASVQPAEDAQTEDSPESEDKE